MSRKVIIVLLYVVSMLCRNTSMTASSSCSSNCSCAVEWFQPVCGRDGLTYFSPCYAGCRTLFGDNVSCLSIIIWVVFVGKFSEGGGDRVAVARQHKIGHLVPYLEVQWPGYVPNATPSRYHPIIILQNMRQAVYVFIDVCLFVNS